MDEIRAPGATDGGFDQLVAPFRAELRAHCYRMSGSIHDADDLLQEGLLRAWRGLAGFEARSSVRTWLYRIVTNVCIDALDRRTRRVLPLDLGPAATPATIGPPRMEPIWIEPCPASFEITDATPEAQIGARESVALAFLSAIQLLPPRQRAVLLLRDVLGWSAAESAELLDMSVPAVTSALQRARDTVATRSPETAAPPEDARTRDLLARYVRAWEDTDVGALVSVLREDATLAMPPIPEWLQGRESIGHAIGHMVFHPGARGNLRLVPTRANGRPAFVGYEREGNGPMRARSVTVIDVTPDGIAAIVAFLDPSLAPAFDCPLELAD